MQSKRVLCTLLLPGKEMYLAFVSQAIVGGLLLHFIGVLLLVECNVFQHLGQVCEHENEKWYG